MRLFLITVFVLLGGGLALATYDSTKATHHNMIEVTTSDSPSAARDRVLEQFTDPDGTKLCVIWKDTTRSLTAVNCSTGATIATTTTSTSTSSSTSTSTTT